MKQASVEADPECISSRRLSEMTGERLRALLQWPRPLPQEEERARLLREVGAALLADFEGQAAEMVRRAGGAATELVRLITCHFPGFRDACVYVPLSTISPPFFGERS